jgi:primase-polymerase (primpol)-like protein
MKITNTAIRNYPNFFKLFEGEWERFYKSHSEADLAFIRMLKLCGATYSETLEIFNKSELSNRDKWRERKDYRDRTIGEVYGNQSTYK